MNTFARQRRIRFSDCDPAGIVFYPQYFVMLNGLVEDWVDEELQVGYRDLVVGRRVGLPSVRLEADFRSPSTLGDAVVLALQVQRVGNRSITLDLRCTSASDDATRMSLRQVIVTTSLETHRSIDVPADLRRAIERFAQAAA